MPTLFQFNYNWMFPSKLHRPNTALSCVPWERGMQEKEGNESLSPKWPSAMALLVQHSLPFFRDEQSHFPSENHQPHCRTCDLGETGSPPPS